MNYKRQVAINYGIEVISKALRAKKFTYARDLIDAFEEAYPDWDNWGDLRESVFVARNFHEMSLTS